VGVRMDGAERVEFKGLDVYNLYESAASGSELCGEYWDEDFSRMEGGGNVHQRAPYSLGFTGNMAHGVMSDWSSFSLERAINVHHIYSTTGLVRALGLYTKSEVIYRNEPTPPTSEPTTAPTTATPTTATPTTAAPNTEHPTTTMPVEEEEEETEAEETEEETEDDGETEEAEEMEAEEEMEAVEGTEADGETEAADEMEAVEETVEEMETTAALQQQTEAAVTAVEGEQWPSDDEGLRKRKMTNPKGAKRKKQKRAHSKQLRPLKELKAFDPFDRRRMAEDDEASKKPGDAKPEGKPKEAAAPKSVAPPKKTEVKPPPKPEPKEADNDEAEWPDLPDSSDTKYGIPDYGDGFEGDDAAGIDAPGDDEGDDDDEQRQQTELNIYYLVAGQSLFGAQSMSSKRPHAPAVAKPFHILSDYRCGDGLECGAESVFQPQSLTMRCVFGSDGTANDFQYRGGREADIDNSGCFSHETKAVELESFRAVAFSEGHDGAFSYSPTVLKSLWMSLVAAAVVICGAVCVFLLFAVFCVATGFAELPRPKSEGDCVQPLLRREGRTVFEMA